ncbi:hypothetical protein B7R21_16505 [Subtercola boreus]|uniref:DUF4232 domain-containing protein n=1 Tax=Subtercola boreus TaxID=120213 RepID=A0A3E0VBQ5_9MICO|nr:DUF4232 domain-containing protein [Subtercola boreus]RFA07191.1 hypothetical protein B7R21_16505 [Subtercola boreus]
MNTRAALFVVAAAALTVTGCAAGQPAPTVTTTTTVTSAPTAPATSTATGTPTPTATAGGQVDPDAPAGQCADSALAVAVTPAAGGAAAGSVFFTVDFTNTGAGACDLRGAPGVSIVGDGNGTQLGSPARQTDQTLATVTLQPGQSVSAPLQQTNIDAAGGPLAGNCTVVPGDGYRIYPPHSFTAFFVASAGILACSNTVDWMNVGPVAAP